MPPAAVDRVHERRAGEGVRAVAEFLRCRASRRPPGAGRRTDARPMRGGSPRARDCGRVCGQPLQSRSASSRLSRVAVHVDGAAERGLREHGLHLRRRSNPRPRRAGSCSCRSPSSCSPGRSIDLGIVRRVVDVIGPRTHAAESCPAGRT